MNEEFVNLPRLEWQITPEEKRKRNKKLILIIWPLLIILIVISATTSYPLSNSFNSLSKGIFYTKNGVILSLLLVVFIPFILLLLNRVFLYKKRTYILDDNKLTVSKGKKKKEYLWSDFDFFYRYLSKYDTNPYKGISKISPYRYGEKERNKIFGSQKEIAGEIFYLKKKSNSLFSKLYKIFIVIYSEPENNDEVMKFLSTHLNKRPMKSTSDLGLVFYKFK
jgi:hypothetical protein